MNDLEGHCGTINGFIPGVDNNGTINGCALDGHCGTDRKATSLAELEGVIKRGLEAYIEVGRALREINERRLYRELGFTRFEQYCEQRWGIARQTAYDYVHASRVAENVRTCVQDEQPSLSQARELSLLTSEEQIQTVQAIQAGGRLSNTTVDELKQIVREVKAGKPPSLAVHFSSENDEWYTPPEIIKCVVRALGAIDLDPCSNSHEDPVVPAAVQYTRAEDGLAQQWHGRVYLNPPYGAGIKDWVQKVAHEYRSGRVTHAIVLVPARTDTEWFRQFRDFAACFLTGRLKFSGSKNSAPFPSAAIYVGDDIDGFEDAFASLGDTWMRRKAHASGEAQ